MNPPSGSVWLLAATFLASSSFASAFTLYVSNERDGTVSVIDGASLEVRETIVIGQRPRGLHLSADGRTLYVATSGSPRFGPGADPERAANAKADKSADGIAIVDLSSSKISRRLPVGSDPEEFSLSADGRRLIVSNEDDSAVSIWDIASGRKVASAAVSAEPEGVTLHPKSHDAYVACEEEGDIFAIDSSDARVRARIRLGGRPRSVTFTSDGTTAYAPLEGDGTVAVLDTANLRLREKIELPAGSLPMGARLSPDGRELYVSTGRANSVVVIDATKHRVIETVSVGQRPWGLALSPDGATLFTANGASDDISVVDLHTRRERRRIKAGAGPWGIALGP